MSLIRVHKIEVVVAYDLAPPPILTVILNFGILLGFFERFLSRLNKIDELNEKTKGQQGKT